MSKSMGIKPQVLEEMQAHLSHDQTDYNDEETVVWIQQSLREFISTS